MYKFRNRQTLIGLSKWRNVFTSGTNKLFKNSRKIMTESNVISIWSFGPLYNLGYHHKMFSRNLIAPCQMTYLFHCGCCHFETTNKEEGGCWAPCSLDFHGHLYSTLSLQYFLIFYSLATELWRPLWSCDIWFRGFWDRKCPSVSLIPPNEDDWCHVTSVLTMWTPLFQRTADVLSDDNGDIEPIREDNLLNDLY